MKPKEIFEACAQKYLIPKFEKLRFKYSSSQKAFSRKIGVFKQTVTFSFNKYNGPDLIDFWSMWNVSSRDYEKWFIQQWREKPVNNVLNGNMDCEITGWRYVNPSLGGHFDLTRSEIYEMTMKDFLRNVHEVGLPYLEKISDWHNAAEILIEKKWFYDKAVDFYLIAGKEEKAKQAAIQGLQNFLVRKRHDNFDETPKLKNRLLKYWNLNESEIKKLLL